MTTTITTSYWKRDNTYCIYHNGTVPCECSFGFPDPESCDVCEQECRCSWKESSEEKEQKEDFDKLVYTRTIKKFNNKSIKKIKTVFKRDWILGDTHQTGIDTSILTFDKGNKMTNYDVFYNAPGIRVSIKISMKEDGSGTYQLHGDDKVYTFNRSESCCGRVQELHEMSFDQLSNKLVKALQERTEEPYWDFTA